MFLERAGFYFQNWNKLLDNWHVKVKKNIDELEALKFDPLPDMVPKEWIFEGRGLDNTYELLENYDRAIQLCYKAWQYHFEFLNLGYAAYLDFFGFCKEQFPNIPDQAIARMVQGIDVDLFRPDDELKKLARLAVESKIDGALMTGSVDQALAAVAALPNGKAWIDAWNAAKNPWFNFTSGNGFYSADKYWIEHLDIPLGYLRDYISQLKRGIKIERPTAEVAAERERITKEYAELLSADTRPVFEQKLGLARTVFPYVENHNFYIEHWSLGVFWRKMRELNALFVKAWLLVRPGWFVLSQSIRGAPGAVGLLQCLGCRRLADRSALLAEADRAAPKDCRCACNTNAAAGAERTAGGCDRALYHHAVGHHDRPHQRVAERHLGEQQATDRDGGIARHRRRPGAGDPLGGRTRSSQGR